MLVTKCPGVLESDCGRAVKWIYVSAVDRSSSWCHMKEAKTLMFTLQELNEGHVPWVSNQAAHCLAHLDKCEPSCGVFMSVRTLFRNQIKLTCS